ncbi:MAG TPA: response regulator [Phycisphaerae bacterium]|nr:response regulator [Phycisphaerae bacterium]HOB76292.1 response regulator [Phycisphaerae bacterium]HOJ56869.1 response regulator [Phycisphaerae bacterium]HOL28588.1 response regulator [Phycisphaerae bacterium]HPP23101.1 response regulator [Phycisphaerae bacterium]
MSKVLVIHHDDSVRSKLEGMIRGQHHTVMGFRDLLAGVKEIARQRPDIVVVGQDLKKEEGTRLLKYLKQNEVKLPVVLIAMRGTSGHQAIAMKLGARGFVAYPVDEARLEAAISEALKAHQAAMAGPPPVTEEELRGNLSMMERQLNARMKCFAGRNQVYIQSMITGGAATRPRICLKCSLRPEYGLSKDVYYEFIRDVCCGDPMQCEAVRKFQAERESA